MRRALEYASSLRGAVVGNTSLSSINGDEGALIYRGLDIHDLARHATFEEVCYLLWFGALPKREQLDGLRAKLFAKLCDQGRTADRCCIDADFLRARQ